MAVEGRTHRPVVDRELCQGCGVCLRACPAECFYELRSDRDTTRGYIYTNTDIASKEGLPPCVDACPISQQVREYVHLLEKKKVKEALLLIRRDNALPGVCGYVCHHPCEQACIRGSWDEPLAIRELKRYAVHYEMDHYNEIVDALLERKQPSRGKKVTIVGAGPAGLACGYELAMQGYSVTIMDALTQPGGMLVRGIPPFRLPRYVVAHDVSVIRALGVRFINPIRIGKNMSLEALQKEGGDALLLAVGAHRAARIGIEGEDGEGFMDWLSFLEETNIGEGIALHGKVLVVGGGNVALDVARSALRSGADRVEVLSLEKEDEVPADPFELKMAKREGIDFRFQVAPVAVLQTRGRVMGVSCAPAHLGWDKFGRRVPMILPGQPIDVKGDFVISATGQCTELSLLQERSISEKGTIELDRRGRIKGYDGIFAGGDAVTGPSTVVEAMGSGKAVARQVMDYLEMM
ncbi:MAG TPA: FAD-dependent oxidoreductase [Desulfatiglandales bacterium]|nr:FAD-dependent oxidoreductase [Desulfatiglandales bacterium]